MSDRIPASTCIARGAPRHSTPTVVCEVRWARDRRPLLPPPAPAQAPIPSRPGETPRARRRSWHLLRSGHTDGTELPRGGRARRCCIQGGRCRLLILVVPPATWTGDHDDI